MCVQTHTVCVVEAHVPKHMHVWSGNHSVEPGFSIHLDVGSRDGVQLSGLVAVSYPLSHLNGPLLFSLNIYYAYLCVHPVRVREQFMEATSLLLQYEFSGLFHRCLPGHLTSFLC